MKLHNVEQGSAEWLALRTEYLTASEMSNMFNCNPFCARSQEEGGDQRNELFHIKSGSKVVFQNAYMKAGHEWEDRIVAEVEKRYNLPKTLPLIGSVGKVLASFDGITSDHQSIIEVKNSKGTYNKILKGNKAPQNYYIQVQVQLFVSGAKIAYFASRNPENGEIASITIEPDKEMMERFAGKAYDFFQAFKDFTPTKYYIDEDDTF